MSTQFTDFLKELIQRFSGSTPKFFRVLTVVGAIATFIGFVPDLLGFLNITLPLTWLPWTERILKISGITIAVVAKLSVQSKVVAKTPEGALLKERDTDKLPFTAKEEIKQAEKLPLPMVTEDIIPTLKPVK